MLPSITLHSTFVSGLLSPMGLLLKHGSELRDVGRLLMKGLGHGLALVFGVWKVWLNIKK